MEKKQINGIGVALVTPFKSDFSIDFKALEAITRNVVQGGVDFIVALGTTGEASLLDLEEKLKVVDTIKKVVDGRIPIVMGYGGNNTQEMIKGFKKYDFTGIDAILTVTPFYVKPSQEGLFQHYKAVADASPRPLILYNVPGRTGVNMEASTTLRLAHHPNIIGIKEASGKLFQIEDIMMRKHKDFLLFSGDDALTYHLVNLGADGVISVTANAYPKEISTLVNNLKEGNPLYPLQIHNGMKELTKAVFADGNPSGIKFVLHRLGRCENVLRLPLVPVKRQVEEELDRCLREFSIHLP